MDLRITGNWKELSKPLSKTDLQQNILEIETSAGLFILKIRDSDIDLKKSLSLLKTLSKAGIPVEVPIETISGDLCVSEGDKRYYLFRRIVGDPINTGFEHINCEMFGNAIARLHHALINIAVDMKFTEMSFVDKLPWLTGGRRFPSLGNSYLLFLSDTLERIESLQKHIIHRDPHPGNIIFNNGKLTGFIDFDLATMGPRIFDIVYCSTAMLSDLFNGQRDSWICKINEITEGYQRLCPLSDAERSLLIPTAIYIQQLFIRFYEIQGDDKKAAFNAMIAKWLFEAKEELQIS
ncbi:MAG: phosphotransferase [Spirochaetales bacterium]|jgi:Ser/Thr protein kinase RdoA (MazF antagonist)|nr:phosphotransferase [Spirochaetales bacterium]